jgi:hypothetical protein
MTEADGSERRTQHAAWRGMEYSCCNHDDKIGHNASTRALTPMPMTAEAAARLSERTASSTAPTGICPISLTKPPIVRTRPISASVQREIVAFRKRMVGYHTGIDRLPCGGSSS